MINKTTFQLIPSILTDSPLELRKMISQAEEAGVKRVQIDVIDGKFTGNRTVDPIALRDIEPRLLVDYHLMVNEPINWVEKCVQSFADCVIGQIEMMGSQLEFIAKVGATGAKVGLAIDLKTPIEAIDEGVIQSLDIILVMSVPAGFGDQIFDPRVLGKIKKLAKIRDSEQSRLAICVDGGITKENIASVKKAGADEVSIGRKIFTGDINQNILMFEKASY